MKGFDYNRWLGIARRSSRNREDAEDLLQESLLALLRVGRSDFAQSTNARRLTGAIRKLALMRARTDIRRRNRDAKAAPPSASAARASAVPNRFLNSLSDASRKVATLVAAGMNREEIISILALSPAAFRQRLTSIRKAWRKSNLVLEPLARTESDLSLGRMRRALLDVIRDRGGIGAYDPDGHLIIFADSSSQKRTSRQH